MRNISIFISLITLLIFASFKDNTQRFKPNIVIINVDDLGWRDVGFMDSKFYETPNIDKLSRQGMVFTNGYASASNCAPSRACLMTGKWTPRHGIYTVGSSERGKSKYRKLIPIANTETLERDLDVFPQILRDIGYSTIHAGKWHLSDDPEDYGFMVNIGGGHNGHPTSYYPPYGNVNLKAENKEYLTDLIMDKTIEYINSIENPFLLYYAPYAVHTPIHPVKNLLNKYRDKPEWNGQNNIDYATMIENLDRNIGILISTLQKKNLYKNTFIIFTSDNGGLYGITNQHPLRAGKGSYYEGGIREPFIFVWNGKINPNTKSDIPITNLDIFPTILQSAGVELENFNYDGQSLIPILIDEDHGEERPLFWHFPIYLQAYNVNENENRDSLFRTRPGSVVRFGDWKLHQYFEDGGLELYNLKEDIGERTNLVKVHPGKVEELLDILNSWRKETNAPIPDKLNPDFKF